MDCLRLGATPEGTAELVGLRSTGINGRLFSSRG